MVFDVYWGVYNNCDQKAEQCCNTEVKIALATSNEAKSNCKSSAWLKSVMCQKRHVYLCLGHCSWIRRSVVVKYWRKQHRFTHGECLQGHPDMLEGDKVASRACHKHTHAHTHIHTHHLMQHCIQRPAGTERLCPCASVTVRVYGVLRAWNTTPILNDFSLRSRWTR